MANKVNNIIFKGVIPNRGSSLELLYNAGDFVIVKKDIVRLMILRCPCGCGDDLLINLDKRAGAAWRLYVEDGSYTLYPSYWRDSHCGSHFIIWNNRVYWCNQNDEWNDEWNVNEEIENKILSALKHGEFSHYIELAEEVELIPWECLKVCKLLCRKNLCIANEGRPKEFFKLR